MRRWLCTVLISASACALEHSSVPWDTGVTAQDVQSPSDIVADDVVVADAPGLDAADAPTAPDVTAADDAIDAAEVAADPDVADAAEAYTADAAEADIVDAAAAPDVVDVVAPTDIIDAGAPVDAITAPDVIDATSQPDIIDVPAPRDVVDATVGADVVDAGVRPDVVVIDVPAAVDAPPPRYTVVGNDTVTTARFGSNDPIGGGDSSGCDGNEVLVGASIQHSQYVNGLAARCARLNADGTFGAVRQAGYAGGASGSRANDDCPAGSVVLGIRGRAGGVVDQLALDCATLASALSDRVTTATPARGQNGGSPFSAQCPPGYIGRGLEFETPLFDFALRVARLRLVCVRVNRQP